MTHLATLKSANNQPPPPLPNKKCRCARHISNSKARDALSLIFCVHSKLELSIHIKKNCCRFAYWMVWWWEWDTMMNGVFTYSTHALGLLMHLSSWWDDCIPISFPDLSICQTKNVCREISSRKFAKLKIPIWKLLCLENRHGQSNGWPWVKPNGSVIYGLGSWVGWLSAYLLDLLFAALRPIMHLGCISCPRLERAQLQRVNPLETKISHTNSSSTGGISFINRCLCYAIEFSTHK